MNNPQPLASIIKRKSSEGAIYLIHCTQTRKTYLGSTGNAIKRLKEQYRQLKTDTHPNQAMQQDFNQYGEQTFGVEFVKLVHRNYDREQLYLDEQDYLDVVKSFEPHYYNQKHKCKKQPDKTRLSKAVQSFIQQHIDPHHCSNWTCDTFEVNGQIKTVISYTFQDKIPHYHTITH